MKALLFGATGAVGSRLLSLLVKEPKITQVVLYSRRPIDLEKELGSVELGQTAAAKVQQIIVPDFDKLAEHPLDTEADVAFCALGTTRAKSGADGFVKVDRDYIVSAASLAKKAACPQFHLISSMGASSGSFFLYTKTKGETENKIIDLKFDKLFIYRPAMLIGARKESRFLGSVGQTFFGTFNLFGSVSIEMDVLAKAMVGQALKTAAEKAPLTTTATASTTTKEAPIVTAYSNAQIIELAKKVTAPTAADATEPKSAAAREESSGEEKEKKSVAANQETTGTTTSKDMPTASKATDLHSATGEIPAKVTDLSSRAAE